MLNLAPYDLDFQPETYWPEGFEPFVPEKDPPPVHRMNKGGEVYQDAGGHWHYVAFPDEVVIVTFESTPPIYLCARRDGDDIRFRYVMPEDAEFQAKPPFLQPGILTSPEPLMCDEIMYLLDFTKIDQTDASPGDIGLIAWLWGIDWALDDSRTGRLFTINAAPKVSSVPYPQLRALYQAIGAHYVQTGELFEVSTFLELLDELGALSELSGDPE